MKLTLSRSTNTLVLKCRRPSKNVAYEFVLTTSCSTQHALLVFLGWFEMGGKWPYNYCFRVLLPGFVENKTLHPRVVFIKLFSSGVSLELKWCNYIVVLPWLQLGRMPFLSGRSDFPMIIDLSIAVFV